MLSPLACHDPRRSQSVRSPQESGPLRTLTIISASTGQSPGVPVFDLSVPSCSILVPCVYGPFPILMMANIELSSRAELDDLSSSHVTRLLLGDRPHRGLLQRFVRFSKLVMAGGFLHSPWLSAPNSHNGVSSHGNSPDIRRHMSGSWNQ